MDFPKFNVGNLNGRNDEPIVINSSGTLLNNRVYYQPANTYTSTLPVINNTTFEHDSIQILVKSGAIATVVIGGNRPNVSCCGPTVSGIIIYRFIVHADQSGLSWVQYSDVVTPVYPAQGVNDRRLITWDPTVAELTIADADFLNNPEIVVIASPVVVVSNNILTLNVTDNGSEYNRFMLVNKTGVLNKLVLQLGTEAIAADYTLLFNSVAYKKATHTSVTPGILELIRYDNVWSVLIRSGTWTWSTNV